MMDFARRGLAARDIANRGKGLRDIKERRRRPRTKHDGDMDSKEDEIKEVAFTSPYALHWRGC